MTSRSLPSSRWMARVPAALATVALSALVAWVGLEFLAAVAG